LIAKSEVRGVIYVHSVNVPYGFRKDDLCLLTALSSPAALALENALLYSGARRTEEALRRSEEKYRVLVENAGEAIVLLREGRIGFANPRAEKLLGNPCEELLQTPFIDLCHPGDRDLFRERHDRCLRQADSAPLTFRIMKGDREPVWVQGIGTPVDCDGEPCTLYFLRDVTGQKTLEDQLLQARKMEAIGTLAAGVAHDFNNLLMGIQGNASLMLLDTDNRHPHYQKLKNIETCVAKGAEITEQMLGFAMEGKYHVETTSLNDLVSRSAKVLSRNNKDIRIAVNLEEDLWPVDIDRRQMDQVLINLYMHAWHSMPAGGEIRLKTANASFAAEVARELGLEPGGYVKLTFSDNGLGLDEKTTKRIFEPFFTSKEMGRGIGLGLASVYGIVKNHGGMITVEGRKGEGTTFILYLPRSKGTLNPSLGVGVPPAESREETRIPPSNPENLMQESAPN
ncbi:MAG: PAS domain S-box protein, partial [Deltaproteobacteria bacterium]|nr:PAS domain S-box protein [Deltaproteobacteria bacterium]